MYHDVSDDRPASSPGLLGCELYHTFLDPDHYPQKEKVVEISLNGLYLCRHRPTLPHTFVCVSREAAKEYSPRRKSWVAHRERASPKGAQENPPSPIPLKYV